MISQPVKSVLQCRIPSIEVKRILASSQLKNQKYQGYLKLYRKLTSFPFLKGIKQCKTK